MERDSLNKQENNQKVLLMLLPFWTPIIPPVGITSIKSYLQALNYDVKTVDANVYDIFRSCYNKYFNVLRKYIPEEKRGNFFGIGHDVLRNHIMSEINYTNESSYHEVVKMVIENTYYVNCDPELLDELIVIVKDILSFLKSFIIKMIEEFNPDVVGLTVNKDTVPASVFAFRLIKKNFPHIKTVMGGPIFSEQLVTNSPDYKFFMEKEAQFIDAIIIGKGEESLGKFLSEEFNNKVIYSESENFIDLEPDYSDHDITRYPYLGLLGSTGCVYDCSFCNVVSFFGAYKKRDINSIVKEMKSLYERHNYQLFFMSDNLINPIISQFSEKLSHDDIALYWSAYIKIDDEGCNYNNVISWRKGGMYCARIGIDSGSKKVLELMDKRILPEQSKQMLFNLARAGIKTTTYWLIGHPGETEEDFQQTLDFIEEMKDYIWEAECEYFNYNYSGQSDSDRWAEIRKPLFPDWTRNMMLIQKWDLKCDPSREVVFDRVCRFANHCKKLGIPNTYTMNDIYIADERWHNLHSNAVPKLISFENGKNYINDRDKIKNHLVVSTELKEQGDFLF